MFSISNIKPQVYLKSNGLFNSRFILKKCAICNIQPMDNLFGKRVKERLKKLNKTQSWLAEKCEVSNNAVAKWIRTNQITLENASKIADFLGTGVDILLGKDVVIAEDKIERQLLFFYRNVTEDHKNDIETFANNLYHIDHPEDILAHPRIIEKEDNLKTKNKDVIHLGDVEKLNGDNDAKHSENRRIQKQRSD